MESLTTDTFFDGRIRIKQNRAGYRFSIDSVLLAAQTMPRSDDTLLDLGTGCGIIPLILAYRYPQIRVYGVEVQEDLAGLAKLNVRENGMENRIAIFFKDLKTLSPDTVSGPVDVVVSNPPYRKTDSGRINPNRQRAVARHEIKATLRDVVDTAYRMLKPSGRLIMIYPAERMTDVLTQMRSARMEPKFLRMVHSSAQTDAKMIIVEGKKGGRPGVKIGSPLIIYGKNGSYTEEVENMFNP